MNEDFTEIEIKEFIGIDIDKPDASVGIFGNTIFLVFKDINDKQVQLVLDDKLFIQLIDEIKKKEINENGN